MNKKKIGVIIAYVLCGLIVATVITLACITANPILNIGNPTSVTITNADGDTVSTNANTELFEKIEKKFDSAFEYSYLSAIFSGKLDKEVYAIVNSSSATVTGTKVEFRYTVEQTLTINGEKTNRKYNYVYFAVSDEGLKKSTLYFRNSDSVYEVKKWANFTELYNFVEEYLENL